MKQYVVDAFADRVFEGNPAAVCLPETWPSDQQMLAIARENRMPETAFAVRDWKDWRLRWFAPSGEVSLCGHATLAAAYAICRFVEPEAEVLRFQTLSGPLTVRRRGKLFELDFPAYSLKRLEVTSQIADALGARPREVWRARDLVCVFDDPRTVMELKPELDKVKALKGALMQVTAPGTGTEYDCVSRTFAPKMGLPEDPVCGSGHCHIVPYWAERLGKRTLTARQASPRGGTLYCRLEGDRVLLAGRAALFSTAELILEGGEP